jgi:metal-responsive CopG/Arc/MetJ family transcriptional regulator
MEREMARVNVFLNDELLDKINHEAKIEKTNRSSLIQTALEEYLQMKRRRLEEEEKRKKGEEACRKMDRLAKKLGDWDAEGLIRKFREKNLKGTR